ncbi:MAG TPA: DUF5995 family protein [Acidimicrobiales bacterium]
MTDPLPPAGPPVTSVDEAIVRMLAIEKSLPAGDGLACFNRMYLDVTQDVQLHIGQGLFSDPAFLSTLDVLFANLYFHAVNALATPPTPVPVAWQPVFAARAQPGIYPIQFALAGMNAHINHDLPLALVQACTQLGTAPDDGTHHDDYQKVDTLLDAAEQSVRQSFESGAALHADRDTQGVLDLVDNWSINAARDVAWDTALALWRSRADPTVEDLMMNGLARTVAMASRCLLVVPQQEHATVDRSLCGRLSRATETLIRG